MKTVVSAAKNQLKRVTACSNP